MLSYEDSKRLEELAYLQELELGDWVYAITDGTHWVRFLVDTGFLIEQGQEPIDYVKVPTTDGMIEGLGVELYSLMPVVASDGTIEYFARGNKARYEGFIKPEPDQALCELWKKIRLLSE